MKLWMMFAIAAVGFGGVLLILDYQQRVRDKEAVVAAQAERERVHQKQVYKAEDDLRAAEFRAELNKRREDEKARIDAMRQEYLEGLKGIVLPEDYEVRKREQEKEWASQDAKELQEAQLNELRQINDKLGK